ncbi:MAG: hypothetical protein KDJ29_20325 [Hyphomicrobiales bacterium]|nr:hypothetical protein [Hyphomicrobiales bacterium]
MKPIRCILSAMMIAGAPAAALAFDSLSSPLPLFAQDGQPAFASGSIFKGFYSGSDFSFAGGGGLRGLPSETRYFGYRHTFKNKVFADVKTRSGFMPVMGGGSVLGYDFSSVRMKTGYSFGRFQPFIAASVSVAAPQQFDALTFKPFGGASNGLNSAAAGTRSLATVTAGFNYKVTNNLSFGAAVSVTGASGDTGPRW